MLYFKELQYSKDLKSLIIDVAVKNSEYYDKINIDSIVIDNQDTYINNGPSSNPIYVCHVQDIKYKKVFSLPNYTCNNVKVEESNKDCFIEDESFKKHIRMELPLNILKVQPNDMLFVYVIATGVPASNTPCGLDNNKIIGTVVNLKNIYTKAISYLREIECIDNCQIPKNFINFILEFKALELSIKTGNYLQAIKYWKKFFTKVKVTSKCSCYGIN